MMDFYAGDSAIDRAFAPEMHGAHAGGAMQDLSNTTAPLPRKRPTAKPATAAAPGAPAPRGGNGNGNGHHSTSDSPAEPASPASNYIQSTPPPQQRSPTATKSGSQSAESQSALTQEQAENMAQIQELQQQLAEVPTDPAQQAAMMARMTGLMSELQNMMSQMARMNANTNHAQPSRPTAAASNPPPVQAAPAKPQATSKYPAFFGTENEPHTPSSVSEHDMHVAGDPQAGLRSTAKPFEPVTGFGGSGRGGGGGYNGGFGGGSRGGGYNNGGQQQPSSQHQQQRYAPVSSISNPYANSSGSPNTANPWNQPNGTMARPQGCVICFVEFKRGRMKRYESDVFIAPGNYIIVEGDRGEDCGLVVHTFQRLPDGSTGRSETLEGVSIDTAKVKPETGRVRRVANATEVERLHGEIATLERHALKACRERVEGMGLDMNVVDCEYQFDRKKITFFFDSARAIDFRELTKDLFKQFSARIWLENINSKVKNVVPDGALSHADKLLYAERGLRPPRR
jgi:hypothetical protein